MPIRTAASAGTTRPVSSSPIASFSPTRRGSRCTPASGTRPNFASVRPKRADSAATAMSHASTISHPPPSATPFTAAITGLVRSCRSVRPAKPVGGRAMAPPSACHFRSLPAQKARPAPVTTATRSAGSASKASNTVARASCAGAWSAFSRSGRFSVTCRIGPSARVSTNVIGRPPAGPARARWARPACPSALGRAPASSPPRGRPAAGRRRTGTGCR